MTYARDQLADRIVPILDPDALDPVAQEQARNVADAVIGMVNAAVLAEREACALILDYMRDDNDDELFLTACDEAADTIRARPPIPD